jgi:hypothetical protein
MYAAAMTTMIAERPTDLSLVRRATDPRERLRRAAEAIESAERQMESRRLRRNAAAVLLFRYGQGDPEPMQPAAMWRDTITVSRSLWHKVMEEADPAKLARLRQELDDNLAELAELPTERASEMTRYLRERDKLARRVARHAAQVQAVADLEAEIPGDSAESRRQLEAIAREEAAEVRRLEALIEEGMKLRDEVAVPLLNGTHGRPMPNAEVARLAKLSTARVAQLRNARFV